MEISNPESNVFDYLRIVWRRRLLVAAAAVVAAAISLFLSARATPIYSSTSRVLFAAQDTSVFQSGGYVAPDPAQIATQEQVMTSPVVSGAVAKKLGAAAASVTDVQAHGVGQTRVLEVTVHATSPTVAARAATAYAETYQQQKRDEAIRQSVQISTELSQKTAEAQQKVQDLEAQIARATAAKASAAELEGLKIQRDAAQTSYIVYQQKADQASVDASVANGGVQVLVRGVVPRAQISPKPRQSAALAIALGLLLGIVAAIGLDFLDDSVKNVEEVERIVRPLPILGAIPAIVDWRNRHQARLVTIEDTGSTPAEAYRSFRTNVQFAGLRREAHVLQVSSPVAAEGKTTTLSNLAVTLSLAGQRVTVVDCDLRRPRVHEFFGCTNELGFTSVLLGDAPLSHALQTVRLPNGGSIHLLASGPLPPNPAELLGTARVNELLAALRADNDYVLIDAPPVLPVTDAVVLSARVDGVVLVATAKVTGRRDLTKALSTFEAAQAPMLGVVVNGAEVTSNYAYEYSYRPHSEDANGNGARERTRSRVRSN
ncbi:MAG TPA: polysaccharide biosynthesis tyrosine autokinase [Acidimicrobiales bacterium]|nr:polysaccharide biosynthesis tyrosine autokinase [Acidimicrobiales bacterium]